MKVFISQMYFIFVLFSVPFSQQESLSSQSKTLQAPSPSIISHQNQFGTKSLATQIPFARRQLQSPTHQSMNPHQDQQTFSSNSNNLHKALSSSHANHIEPRQMFLSNLASFHNDRPASTGLLRNLISGTLYKGHAALVQLPLAIRQQVTQSQSRLSAIPLELHHYDQQLLRPPIVFDESNQATHLISVDNNANTERYKSSSIVVGDGTQTKLLSLSAPYESGAIVPQAAASDNFEFSASVKLPSSNTATVNDDETQQQQDIEAAPQTTAARDQYDQNMTTLHVIGKDDGKPKNLADYYYASSSAADQELGYGARKTIKSNKQHSNMVNNNINDQFDNDRRTFNESSTIYRLPENKSLSSPSTSTQHELHVFADDENEDNDIEQQKQLRLAEGGTTNNETNMSDDDIATEVEFNDHDNNNGIEQQTVSQHLPDNGLFTDSSQVIPQLPVKYDTTSIQTPPDGYYDDYFKPQAQNQHHNSTDGVEQLSSVIDSANDNYFSTLQPIDTVANNSMTNSSALIDNDGQQQLQLDLNNNRSEIVNSSNDLNANFTLSQFYTKQMHAKPIDVDNDNQQLNSNEQLNDEDSSNKIVVNEDNARQFATSNNKRRQIQDASIQIILANSSKQNNTKHKNLDEKSIIYTSEGSKLVRSRKDSPRNTFVNKDMNEYQTFNSTQTGLRDENKFSNNTESDESSRDSDSNQSSLQNLRDFDLAQLDFHKPQQQKSYEKISKFQNIESDRVNSEVIVRKQPHGDLVKQSPKQNKNSTYISDMDDNLIRTMDQVNNTQRSNQRQMTKLDDLASTPAGNHQGSSLEEFARQPKSVAKLHQDSSSQHPDKNELMIELLTALDRVKAAIYKLQPLTAKMNAIYRKSVPAPTNSRDNNQTAKSSDQFTSESVASAVYVRAPRDVESQVKSANNSVVGSYKTPIVATGIGRRLDGGRVEGQLQLSNETKFSFTDSLLPGSVTASKNIDASNPMFGYRITIFPESNFADIFENVEIDDNDDNAGQANQDFMATSESSVAPLVVDKLVGGNKSEDEEEDESHNRDQDDYRQVGEESKKVLKSAGKKESEKKIQKKEMKKAKKSGEKKESQKSKSKKKKAGEEMKKKKEFKKVKHKKEIMKKEKKALHRDKRVKAHDRGAAKEKALKERTQIEFFEREQIVDDEYEKGKKSTLKANWMSGKEASKTFGGKLAGGHDLAAAATRTLGDSVAATNKYHMYQEPMEAHETVKGSSIGKEEAHFKKTNKFEKKHKELKGKKFKGWREKGYKIITETEFIDRGSLHDSAYKKRDKGGSLHHKEKKLHSMSEGQEGKAMEEKKKKKNEKENKKESKMSSKKEQKMKDEKKDKKKMAKHEEENKKSKKL